MRNFHFDADYMNTKEYRKAAILEFHYEHRNLFEKAAAESIDNLKYEISKTEDRIKTINQELSNVTDWDSAEPLCQDTATRRICMDVIPRGLIK